MDPKVRPWKMAFSPQKSSSKLTFLYHETLPLKKKVEHLFCLSHQKTWWTVSMDNVILKICLLGTSNFMVTVPFFPWCNHGTSLKTNHKFYRALGRLHGAWCKQPLIAHPHILVQATSERILLAGATFSPGSATERHWLKPMLVLTVRWWPHQYVWVVKPNIFVKFIPIPKPHPSAATYAHPCPPIAWHVPTHAHPCYSNCAHVFKIVILPITPHPCPPKSHGHGWAWAPTFFLGVNFSQITTT